MTDYKIALFLHVAAAIGLFGGSTILHLALFQAREARTVADARVWAGVIRRFAPLMPVMTILIVAPALYMVEDVWGWRTGWVQVAVVTLALSIPVGPLVLEPRMKALGRALGAAPDGPITPTIARHLTDPVLWTAEQALTAAAVGEVVLMSFKPGLTMSVASMAVIVGAGALTAVPLRRRRADVPAPTTAALSGD